MTIVTDHPATAPRSIRDQALDVIERNLRYRPADRTPLKDFGTLAGCMLLIDLEQAFGVLIDVDEVLPHGDVGDLLALINRRTCSRPIPVTPANLIDLAAERAARGGAASFAIPVPPPPTHAETAHAVRARLPRETHAGRLMLVIGLIAIAAGFLAGLAFFAPEHFAQAPL